MKKLMHILFLSALLTFLLVLPSKATVYRLLNVGYLAMSDAAEGSTWMSEYTSTGEWGSHYRVPWEAWIPPGQDSDIGYHGVDVDNVGHFDHGGKNIPGQSAWWVATRNWTAPPAGQWGPSGIEGYLEGGKTYDLYVNDNGPNSLFSLINTPVPGFEAPIVKRRVAQPAVKVDGAEQRPVGFVDPTQYEVDPGLITDGMMETKWTDPCGVTFHRKTYAWTNPEYANIIICEVTITNEGDVNAQIEGIEKPNQTLTDFWVGVKHLITNPEGWCNYGSYGEYNGSVDWMLEYDPATRYFWVWDGDAADIPGDDQFDPRGGPGGQADLPTGEYLVPEIAGIAFLHIDKSGTDDSDDPNQPATFRYISYVDEVSPLYDNNMEEGWNWMTAADGNPPYQKGFGDDPYQTQPSGQPHWDPIWGVGPYTLGPGEDIKLVYVWAIASIGEAKAIELGWKVKNAGLDPAEAKRQIYETGRDRLFAEFEKARDLYFNKGLKAPFLPDPPTNLTIVSGPEEVKITWDPVDGAAKYRVYRAVGGVDNGRVYQMIKETTDTEYLDPGLIRGFSYYYYVTAVDANGLESSHFFNQTNKAAVPFRRGVRTADWADAVRVVPNPHNVKGNTYIEDAGHNMTGFNYDGNLREQNTVTFVNLPEYCTIRIYNSVGDLIKVLEHTTGSADERWWPVITDDNQIPASGVYFYTIEVTEGPLAGQVGTGKLVLIR